MERTLIFGDHFIFYGQFSLTKSKENFSIFKNHCRCLILFVFCHFPSTLKN